MIYDKLLIATGGHALKPKIEGIDAKNVYYLRSHLD
jgi:NADPH-dependent 2,4-dienoyl-CoA reductase/sulfur reductase-like enzyme